MSLDAIVISASVSEIVYELVPYYRRGRKKWYSMGNNLHYKLGYMNYERYVRIWDGGNYKVKVAGVPDKIDWANSIVRELKVSTNGLTEEQIARARLQLQLYMWLTGLEEGCLDTYVVTENKLKECVVHEHYNPNVIDSILKQYAERVIEKENIRQDLVQKYGK